MGFENRLRAPPFRARQQPSERLFTDKRAFAGRGNQFDVSADGQRFVVVETLREPKNAVRVVENWFAEFE